MTTPAPTPRTTLSKTTRFEVFKRDAFTCQYCGRAAPEVVLQVDHVHPVAHGGTNDLLNLVTACHDCNGGKGARLLSDDTVVMKNRAQLAELAERQEQVAMLLAWRRGLDTCDDAAVVGVIDYWQSLTPGWEVTDAGKATMRRLLKRYSAEEVLHAMRIAADEYLRYDEHGHVTDSSWSYAWQKIGGVCRVTREAQTKPHLRELYYIRGILRNRLAYVREQDILPLLEEAYEAGTDLELLRAWAKEARSWTDWRTQMEEWAVD